MPPVPYPISADRWYVPDTGGSKVTASGRENGTLKLTRDLDPALPLHPKTPHPQINSHLKQWYSSM